MVSRRRITAAQGGGGGWRRSGSRTHGAMKGEGENDLARDDFPRAAGGLQKRLPRGYMGVGLPSPSLSLSLCLSLPLSDVQRTARVDEEGSRLRRQKYAAPPSGAREKDGCDFRTCGPEDPRAREFPVFSAPSSAKSPVPRIFTFPASFHSLYVLAGDCKF
jgi:hypothetical protein